MLAILICKFSNSTTPLTSQLHSTLKITQNQIYSMEKKKKTPLIISNQISYMMNKVEPQLLWYLYGKAVEKYQGGKPPQNYHH